MLNLKVFGCSLVYPIDFGVKNRLKRFLKFKKANIFLKNQKKYQRGSQFLFVLFST